MRLDHLARDLDPAAATPLALQVARALAQAILQGQLKPGEDLPGTRDLATSLACSRYAVLGALKELEAEGFVEVRPASGARVADHPPALVPRMWGGGPELPRPQPLTAAFAISSRLAPITAISDSLFDLREAGPDPRLAPQKALAKAYQRALARHGDALLGPGEPKGNLTLRMALSDFLRAHRGLCLDPEQLLITRGSPQGLQLLLEALLRKGGTLAVERPTDPALLDIAVMRPTISLLGIGVDGGGLRVEDLADPAKKEGLAAVLLQPVAQVPTGSTLTSARRAALLDLAAHHRFAIIEEDSGFATYIGGEAPLPLAAQDPGGSVVYLLSLARLVAPGLGIGLLAGPVDLVDRLARLRRESVQQGDRVLEWAVGDLIRDGDLERTLRRNARTYGERLEAVEFQLGEQLPAGFGLAGRTLLGLHLQADSGDRMAAWIAACDARSVRLRPVGEQGAWMGTATLDAARLPDLFARLREARALR